MMKTSDHCVVANPLAVDVEHLMGMLCLGKASAVSVGLAAGAEISIGRRKIYNVAKIQKWLDEHTELQLRGEP